MIVDPILVIGAPRSGTSLLQKIVRESPGIWSLPSEGNEIWDEWCHPKLKDWASEAMVAKDLTPEARGKIWSRFEKETRSHRIWKMVPDEAIWSMRRKPVTRSILRKLYYGGIKLLPSRNAMPRRILDKTASTCFRIEYVRAVFPKAKILFITRDGRKAVESLMRGWLHPSRFFTYPVPCKLDIDGYTGSMWNFVLPPGWRAYTNRPLEEVCAFQWISSNQHVLDAIAGEQEGVTYLNTKLEDIIANPSSEISRIKSFLDIPSPEHAEGYQLDLPKVNASEKNEQADYALDDIEERVRRVTPQLEDMLSKLGYPT